MIAIHLALISSSSLDQEIYPQTQQYQPSRTLHDLSHDTRDDSRRTSGHLTCRATQQPPYGVHRSADPSSDRGDDVLGCLSVLLRLVSGDGGA